MTRDYLQLRVQYGAPLARQQALQHRMADMLVSLEQARSLLHFGIERFDAEAADRWRAVSMVKVGVAEAARFVGENAVQLHGGLGVTADHPVSHHYWRLLFLSETGGDAHHLERLDELLRVEEL